MGSNREVINGVNLEFNEKGFLETDFDALREQGGQAGLALMSRELDIVYSAACRVMGLNFGLRHRYAKESDHQKDDYPVGTFFGGFGWGSSKCDVDHGIFQGAVLQKIVESDPKAENIYSGLRLTVQDYVSSYAEEVLHPAMGGFFGHDEHRTNEKFGKDLVVATVNYHLASENRTEVGRNVPSVEWYCYDEFGNPMHEIRLGEESKEKTEVVHCIDEEVRGNAEYLIDDLTCRAEVLGKGAQVERDGHIYNNISYIEDRLRLGSTEPVILPRLEIEQKQ